MFEEYREKPERIEKAPEALPIEVPLEILSEDALAGVMDNFIQREGTDYGAVEASYESKIKTIRRQLDKGEIKIVFDSNSESVTLVTLNEWNKINKLK